MPVIYDIQKKGIRYRRCRPTDIEDHFAKIRHWVTDENGGSFKKRMLEAVKRKTAWCTENTFLYYVSDGKAGIGYALFGRDYPVELISLFMGVFSYHDKDTAFIRFKLHPGKMVDEYKTLLTSVSMSRYHTSNETHPLMIRVDELRKKWAGMMAKRYGVEQ